MATTTYLQKKTGSLWVLHEKSKRTGMLPIDQLPWNAHVSKVKFCTYSWPTYNGINQLFSKKSRDNMKLLGVTKIGEVFAKIHACGGDAEAGLRAAGVVPSDISLIVEMMKNSYETIKRLDEAWFSGLSDESGKVTIRLDGLRYVDASPLPSKIQKEIEGDLDIQLNLVKSLKKIIGESIVTLALEAVVKKYKQEELSAKKALEDAEKLVAEVRSGSAEKEKRDKVNKSIKEDAATPIKKVPHVVLKSAPTD